MKDKKKTFINNVENFRHNGVKKSITAIYQRIKKRATIPIDFIGLPEKYHIETTTLCNLHCEYCVLRENVEHKMTMSFPQFEQLRPYFKYAQSIVLSGLAEPLMNKHIVEFIHCIKSENSHCKVSMVSNATLLTEIKCAEIVDVGLDRFDFSLDAIDPMVNDTIRKGSNSFNILSNIKRLVEEKKKRNARFPLISAVTVLQKKNYRMLPIVIKTLSDLGITKINVNFLEPYAENYVENALWYAPHFQKNLPDILEQSIAIAKNRGITVVLPEFFPMSPSCNSVNKPLILPNGDVSACSVLAYKRDSFFTVDKNNQVIKIKKKNDKKIFGNVFNKNFRDIWFEKEYVQFRENVLNRKFPEECGNCLMKYKFICAGAKTPNDLLVSNIRKNCSKQNMNFKLLTK